MIILASQSPRRKEILEKHGINPTIIKPEVDESIPSGFSSSLTVEQTVMYMALKKALSVYNNDLVNIHEKTKYQSNSSYIIAADTVVYDGRILGKPADLDEAFVTLKSLKGKFHLVLTGVAITDTNSGFSRILCDTSKVHFKNYSDHDIRNYISTDSPLDKAGSYAIQSKWSKQVEEVEGDLENVIGLPWHRIEPLINNHSA